MALAIFPELDGLSWNVIRRPKLSTSVTDHVSGRSSRFGYWASPMYEWEFTYDLLRDFPWVPGINSEMRRLQGFFLAMGGKLTGFLYKDPDDGSATGQFLGTSDGDALTTYPLIRSFGDPGYPGASIAEPVGYLGPNGITLYLDGIQQALGSDYTFDANIAGQQLISLAPFKAAGHVITADFDYYFYVHFKDDALDFEKFAGEDGAGYWQIKKLTLESLRPELIT